MHEKIKERLLERKRVIEQRMYQRAIAIKLSKNEEKKKKFLKEYEQLKQERFQVMILLNKNSNTKDYWGY